jgi:putative PIN family toxin of toxin-antitoxin system
VTFNRYVFDTNVLISAVFSPRSSAFQAYQKALDTGILLASPTILAEYESVFLREKFDRYVPKERRQAFLDALIAGVERINVQEFITDCRDPKDNVYLEVAVYGRANAIVTGDRDLLILHPYRGIDILSPVDFLNNGNNSGRVSQ